MGGQADLSYLPIRFIFKLGGIASCNFVFPLLHSLEPYLLLLAVCSACLACRAVSSPTQLPRLLRQARAFANSSPCLSSQSPSPLPCHGSSNNLHKLKVYCTCICF